MGSGFREWDCHSKLNGEWLREIFRVNLWLPHARAYHTTIKQIEINLLNTCGSQERAKALIP